MKRIQITLAVLVLAAFSLASGFAQGMENCPMKDGKGKGDCPMMGQKGAPGFGGIGGGQGRMGMGRMPGMMEGMQREMAMLKFLNLQTNMESFRINVEKVQLDSREKGIPIRAKMKELNDKLDALVDKAATDKNAAAEIPQVMKEIVGVRQQEQKLMKETREKIQSMHESHQKEIGAAVDAYIQKLSTDKAELDKFIQFASKKDRKEEGGRPMRMR